MTAHWNAFFSWADDCLFVKSEKRQDTVPQVMIQLPSDKNMSRLALLCFTVVMSPMTFLCYYFLLRSGKIARDASKFLKYSYHSGAQNVSWEAWTPLLW